MSKIYSTSEEYKKIENARRNVSYLYFNTSCADTLTIQRIEEVLKTNYHTFRSWCRGLSDYFDDKLPLLAELFEISLDELTADTLP